MERNMNLRKHQSQFDDIIDGIISGSGTRNIIVQAVPGSGKSSIPIIAGKLITAGLADALCWICPRSSLQDQAERNFIDPFFRKMFDHRLTIRSSTNEHNPCRGLNGFVTTYQALGVDKNQTVLQDFRRRRYILILDECHHASAEEGAAWTEALKPLYDLAEYRIMMTGTMLRGDGNRIAFVNDHAKTEKVIYTRRDALEDKAILPLEFHLFDGKSKWKTAEGNDEESLISTNVSKKSCYALYTALNTDYARELLSAAVIHWRQHKAEKGHGKLLVVAANIRQAKQYTAYLKSIGEHAKIATSDDTPAAVKVIKEFKTGHLSVLVSVSMAYEGLDVPAISHIACLTNIRSLPWIAQMVARAVRIDPAAGPYETQTAYVFAPKDKFFVECKEQIEKDQQWIKEKREKEKKDSEKKTADGEFVLTAPGGIIPLSSSLSKSAKNISNTITLQSEVILTSSERETQLLDEIDTHIGTYAFNNRMEKRRLNAEVFQHFGKARRQMTITELERCLKHVQQIYPLSRIRGTGHPRVPTKAVRIG